MELEDSQLTYEEKVGPWRWDAIARSYASHTPNTDDCAQQFKQAVDAIEELLTTARRSRMKWYGHVIGSSPGLAKTFLPGTVAEKGRGERNRKAEKEMRRQRSRMVRPELLSLSFREWHRTAGADRTGRKVISGAHTTHRVTGQIG